jgi:tripartite-type tricarboxylate transporter receptor subunit TctC
MFASPLEVMAHVKVGRLNVLGVTSAKRLSYWPEVPTVIESGYPDYEALAWFGVVAPAATPRDVSEKLAAQGAEIAGTTPEAFAEFLGREHARWSEAVKAANVTVQ